MKKVDLYFDYASAWAYIAEELLPRKLPGITVTHHPIYLRGLETFSKGLPYTAAKLQYLARDLARVAEHEGVRVQPPASFPIDGVHALRAAYVARDSGAFDRYHRATFRAAGPSSVISGKRRSSRGFSQRPSARPRPSPSKR